MEFLLLFNERKGTPPTEAEGSCQDDEVRGRVAQPRGVPARRAAGSRSAGRVGVRVRDGKAFVTDGAVPRNERGDRRVLDRSRPPTARKRSRSPDIVRMRSAGRSSCTPCADRYTFTDSENGTPFLFAFRMEPASAIPTARSCARWSNSPGRWHAQGTVFETAPLADDPPAARIEARAGKVVVTDGPFAETKDAIGGYSLVRTSGIASGGRARQTVYARGLGAGRGARDPVLRSGVKRRSSSPCRLSSARPLVGRTDRHMASRSLASASSSCSLPRLAPFLSSSSSAFDGAPQVARL